MEVPNYIAANARQGLRYYDEGLAGSGVTEQTISEARALARGEATEDKIVRANAWAARHAVDLESARNSNPDNPGYPGPGAVAHLLWGINPRNPGKARSWFERMSNRIKQARALASALDKVR